MIEIFLEKREFFDEKKQEFIELEAVTLLLEHSLVSLSKWESIWKKPFLSSAQNEFTTEETNSYIKCMTLVSIPDIHYRYFPSYVYDMVREYILDPMTASTPRKINGPPDREIVTAEIIYFRMISFGIPFECQEWHLNRLLTLIKVCSIGMSPPKKPGPNWAADRKKLNEQRKLAHKTKG